MDGDVFFFLTDGDIYICIYIEYASFGWTSGSGYICID